MIWDTKLYKPLIASDIRLYFTQAFSRPLLCSSRFIQPNFASFLTFLRAFHDSLCAFYLLLSLVTISPFSLQPSFTQNPLSTNLNNNNNFLRLTKLQLCRYCCFTSWLKLQSTKNYCSTTTSPAWFPSQNRGCKLFANAAPQPLAYVEPLSNA